MSEQESGQVSGQVCEQEKIKNALKCLEMDMLDNTQIELLLNYIGELQKENKELKDTDLTSVYMKGFYDSKSKWEEKVKNKTKELDETKQYWTEDVIDILDELLKE